MIIPHFRDWRIRAKLISVTLFLVLVPLLFVSYLSMNRFGSALRSAAEEAGKKGGHKLAEAFNVRKIGYAEDVEKVLNSLQK